MLSPPQIVMSYRAHCINVSHIERLAGTKTLMTFGADKRLFCFDINTGALLGFVQRVLLNQPSPFINRYFSKDVRDLATLKLAQPPKKPEHT